MSGEIRGPKAPKDPTKKRPCFFVMRSKEVTGSPQPDGTGVQFIYEDGGRLINSAKIIGNISDEEILKLLETTEGFRTLVYSIGVTVEADNRDEEINFAFQMYGKTDMYGGGTTINKLCKANGMENVILMDDIQWSDDDKCPGQIRFEFNTPGKFAKVGVCFYLNDGFDAPKPEEEESVDINSPLYKKMIEKSLMNIGNNYRIKTAIDKARRGEDVTLAFIGGSITQGAGAIPINTECYAYKIYKGFLKLTGREEGTNVHYCKAGVGGTPSELGMLRYDQEIIDEVGGPDIVVVEFAVNDEGDETKGVCYDSLVRKIWNGKGNPAVILLFSVFADDYNLQDRLSPVGYGYNIPMVSTKNSVVEQFYLKKGEGKVVSKSQYFYDVFHPTNIGHTIMADGVISLMEKMDQAQYDEKDLDIASMDAPIGKTFENVKLIDRKHNVSACSIDMGDFTDLDDATQGVERNMDLSQTKEFPDNYSYKGNVSPKANPKPLTVNINCKSFLGIFKDSGEVYSGKVDIYADGVKKMTYDPKEIGWNHCNPVIIINEKESSNHTVEFRVTEGFEDKEFTILGFGYVE